MGNDVDHSTGTGKVGNDNGDHRDARIELEARPEQRLIRSDGCTRFVDFRLVVPQQPTKEASTHPERAPLALALVLDRSGSMQGAKLDTAKRAALAVIDRLDERDRVALVIFDNQIETIQPAAA